MSQSVTMPALGESVTEGTVTRWLKNVGDQVQADEPLLEVSTDKVDTEVPAPASGVLLEILVAEDETVAVGTALATLGDPGEAPQQATQPQSAQSEQAQAPREPQQQQSPASVESAAVPTTSASSAPDSGSEGDAVPMPALGESVTEGTVTRWLKNIGDQVQADEPLLEVSTDKVDTEVPAPASGILTKILVNEDETVDVGTTLAFIGGAGSAPAPQAPVSQAPAPQVPATPPAPAMPVTPSAPIAAPPAPSLPVPPAPKPSVSEQPGDAAGSASQYVTPLVRKLAVAKGVDLATVTGTGVGGRVRKQDVLAAAEKATTATPSAASGASQAPTGAGKPSSPASTKLEPSALRGTTEKMTRLRKIIAERMVDALQTTAQLTTVVEVDMTKVAALRGRAKADFKAREGVNLTFLPFIALAAVEALKAYPKINATITEEEIVYHPVENLGIAVDSNRGLVVPVIKNAGDLNIAGLSRQIADLGGRTRDNKVTPDELQGGTFTITNTGSGGALFDTPIVPQPQVAILGTGTITKRPVVIRDADGNDVIAIRSMMYLELSYDHRLVDGADASRYLMAVKARLEEGAFEADLGL